MKLIRRIGISLSLATTILLSLWAGGFYLAMIEELNDETDDMLEEYSEQVMRSYLAGQPIEEQGLSTNNGYTLKTITETEAIQAGQITTRDTSIYVWSEHEMEPARVYSLVFRDGDGQAYRLSVFTPTIDRADFVLALFYWVVGLLVLLLVVMLAINLLVYNRSLKPLYRLLSWIRSYRIGQTNRPLVNDTTTLEFRELNTALIEHTQRAEEAYEAQKSFIGNMSHELQTPLAVSRHHLELLLEDDTLDEQQLGRVSRAYDSLEFMTRLNKTLLMLFRIDNQQYPLDEEIDLCIALQDTLSTLREVYGHLGVNLIVDLPSPIMLRANQTLVQVLCNNLLRNAFAYNRPGGEIVVRAQGRRITIANTSTREEALDEERLFSRFYQPERRSGSTGLGLALIQSVCRELEIAIHYRYEGEYHCFVLEA